MTRRTVQEEQARLRKQRKKAQGFLSIFKKPLHESLTSVLPIMLIVLALGFTIAPVPNNAMMAFLLGGVLLIVGMGLFTLGSEMSMIPLGQAVGSEITRSKNVWIIVGISFLIGIIITVAEPDLQVLANQVPAIENNVIIWSVAVGVGVCLVIALLRILLGLETADSGEITGLSGKRLAAVFQEDRLLEQLDAAGNLRFALGAAYDEAAARALLAELGLGDAGGKRVRDWSGGMKRRLALARALLAPSDALALDAPFTGLDADNRAAAQRCVARAAREKIVLLVSHEDDALTGAEVRLQ